MRNRDCCRGHFYRVRGNAARSAAGLAAAIACVALAGCGRWAQASGPFAGEMPTPEEAVAFVNENARRVQSLLATDLHISVRQRGRITMPLEGNLALEKPRRFRLIANAAFSRGADLGSNDEEFWGYIQDGERPVLVHARYDEYTRAGHSLLLQPEWIIDALGLTPLPSNQDRIVSPGRRGTIEIVTPTTTPQGVPASKITVVQQKTGLVVEQHLEVGGQRIASALLSGHRADPESGAVLPRVVTLRWPEQGLEIKLRFKAIEVNPQFDPGRAARLWSMPREVTEAGAEDVDLGAPDHPRGRRHPGVRLGPPSIQGSGFRYDDL